MNLMGHGIIRSHGPFVCFTPTRQVVRLPSVVYLAPHNESGFRRAFVVLPILHDIKSHFVLDLFRQLDLFYA
jgi:hypothetical protein